MWGRIRQIWMPSNHKALLASQEALLSQFNSTRLWSKSVAVGDGDVINYVDSLYEDGSKSSDGRSLANTNRRTTKHGIDSVQSDIPLVMLHGYGSGLGFFFRNYDAMCARVPRVLGVDWLGMGGSSRPRRCSLPPRVPLLCRGSFSERQAIDFFTDALEKWRESVGLDRFHLLGHSLGGYLVAQYALKYPERVESLTMASPAGIAHPPAPRQILSDQGQSVSPPALPLSLRLIDAAWANNVTPQQLIRMFGRRGPGLTLSAVKRRFGAGRTIQTSSTVLFCSTSMGIERVGSTQGVVCMSVSRRVQKTLRRCRYLIPTTVDGMR
ncbi:hypothetical protein SARC_01379 [Sphaeroforma arctica JP610]|uniref:AB hydrolase-1 domain-containing protein n=1 Tax=Sphaeroforma arctica JP610 TaxID=667725 RepID=A0A0L0GC34_9EUKA|nr:hypothetical protein SARC_01379 [Sphaeroforma arctica JP610]KNC86469.1 hypothetical protein SARC_01379 [Sphaeroforma arctica JP610]|eukprot:XP_014160371.1 hypothetical protein SARC_01379 [Sphaeroforma arctica JP610]